MRHHIEPEGDDINIACPLTVAEQCAFNPVRTCHQPKFSGGNACAPVIMGMQGKDQAVTAAELAVHPFDLIGMDIRRRHFHRCRQVHDTAVIRRRLPDIHDAFTDLKRVFELSTGKAFRRILQLQIGAVEAGDAVSHHLGAVGGNGFDPGAVFTEDNTALQCRRRIIDMQDRVFGTLERIKGLVDEMLPRLCQHLNGDIIGDMVTFDKFSAEIEISIGSRRKADLDLSETHLHKHAEHRHFAGAVHGLNQGLIAVAQINTAPDRCFGDGVARPGTIRQIDRRIGLIFAVSVISG